ncbi:MAG: ATP-dependent DNA helicase RecG [Proteobacteria bacterium]|uniref:ATP-dependent DNA helicase RecG n=1 Tax=SAR92 bacterium BACL26 MAG-121220-bin70 TaxID=1655626 RepID=A0A0R2UE78_9GAMM|nr:MAG: ATP-dependent DNA helicase RecG [SAR92 bacterium BACL26 MAG-121220-bin70]MDA0796822.1 ATP-dependent DNA helicase RecG [Pseudomonadota bacterium]MDA1352686.1 ATP-dependent DNA helicase RecG [Pseudomonadota bacterium]
MSKSPLDKLSIGTLRGVGPQLAIKLQKIGLYNIQDLLFHLPLRYIDRTQVTPIGAVQPQTEVVIEGEIRACDTVFGRRRSLVCRIQDHSGTTTLRFFHFNRAQQDRLRPGVFLRCFGEARPGKTGIEFYHPEYQHLDQTKSNKLDDTLTPIYPATEGISQSRIRALCAQALTLLNQESIVELLPNNLNSDLSRQLSYSLNDALQLLHNPPPGTALHLLAVGEHPAQQRLAAEELIAHNLSLLRLRQKIQRQQAPALLVDQKAKTTFLNQLSFQLTKAQQKVSAEICSDISTSVPMLRLVQGDVGSGKTVVAALAAVQAIANGKQTALMAPTEILAEQHRVNFEQWLQPLGIRIAWLTGKIKGKAREIQLKAIADGSAQMVIGTHALFQETVSFKDLGLSIIDEQHRFGVHQRLALRSKGFSPDPSTNTEGSAPHQLIMTATPIPRTLAMSAYADLDCSVIDELPPGRTPVGTLVLSNLRRPEVIARVRAACVDGRQAYWVCTLIEESDVLEAQAAEVTASELKLLLPELSIGLIHGRLKPREKLSLMDDFKAGKINLLVATTVIEVGVDVPNASLMIIENSERLGLSQLHQLRGRVGRGSQASHCVLLYSPPLVGNASARLKIMRETTDGFKIAEKDLELRGPGEVLGTRQTGDMRLHIADLQRDAHMLPQIKSIAAQLLVDHPKSIDPLIRRWLGHKQQYAQA